MRNDMTEDKRVPIVDIDVVEDRLPVISDIFEIFPIKLLTKTNIIPNITRFII